MILYNDNLKLDYNSKDEKDYKIERKNIINKITKILVYENY